MLPPARLRLQCCLGNQSLCSAPFDDNEPNTEGNGGSAQRQRQGMSQADLDPRAESAPCGDESTGDCCRSRQIKPARLGRIVRRQQHSDGDFDGHVGEETLPARAGPAAAGAHATGGPGGPQQICRGRPAVGSVRCGATRRLVRPRGRTVAPSRMVTVAVTQNPPRTTGQDHR